MEILDWKKAPVDGDEARALRRDIRMRRRERGRGGHRFRFDDLKALWVASTPDGDAAVLTHHGDSIWQLWRHDDTRGWLLTSWHFTRREAQVAALKPVEHPEPPRRDLAPGIHVVASWPKQKPSIRVICTTPYTAQALEDVMTSLGCDVLTETVS